MRKLTFSLGLVLLVLVGCGSQTGTTDNNVETVTWSTIGTEPSDEQLVEDAMNEILVPEVGAKIDIVYYDYSEYNDKMNLKFESNDEMDIVFAPAWAVPYEENVQAGKYLSLTPYIEDGTLQPTYDAVNPDFWEGVTVGDEIYAIPTNKELATQQYALLDQSLVDKYDFDTSTVKTYKDLEPFLKEVTEGEGYPATSNDINWQGIQKHLGYDCIASLQSQVCLDPNDDQAGYKWVYDIEEYKEGMSYVNDLIDQGLMKSDTLDMVDFENTDYGVIIQEGYPGAEIGWEQQFGRDFATIPIGTPIVTTDSTRGSMNIIASSSTHPELAAKVLNEVNTNPQIRTLFAYGIEGNHYNLNADQEMVFTENQKNYASQVYTQGNFFILPLLEGEPKDKWELFDKQNKNSTTSPALGFSPDLSEYSAEIANIINMLEKHKPALELGNFNDIDADIASGKADLEAVGFFDVIDEVNAQYSAWLEENK